MMPGTAKSSVRTTNPKPNNVFYIWYTELCRRLNSNPAAIIKPAKPKCNTVLDFAADRLKFEDWSPLINALRHDTSLHVISIRSRTGGYQFLHDVDTEDKARRMRRKYGSLWTDYILNSLVRALSYSLRNTQVLTSLELDGLPMFTKYLDVLLKALKENQTVKYLSLTNCSIQDTGCRTVCLSLQLMPNIDNLNLSRCDLTSISGTYIAKLIKFQQLNRYTTSWHKSLRYSEPDSGKMCGIRRITLNCNPALGDEGLDHILNELEDDLWIRALDMQKCGVTENISRKLLDVLQYNQSLLIADFRQNENLSSTTLEKVLDILRQKKVSGDGHTEFQWCRSVLSLCPSTFPASSRGCMTASTAKTLTTPSSKTNGVVKELKRSKTVVDMIKKNINGCVDNARPMDATKRKLIQLKVETNSIPVQNDLRNQKEEVQKKINHINGSVERNHTLTSVIKAFNKLHFTNDNMITKEVPTNTPNGCSLRKARITSNLKKKNVRNGYHSEPEHHVTAVNSVEDIVEKYFRAHGLEPPDSSDDEFSLISLCENYDNELEEREDCGKSLKKADFDSDSQISLFEWMEELQQENAELPNDPKLPMSKHHYKGKKNGIK